MPRRLKKPECTLLGRMNKTEGTLTSPVRDSGGKHRQGSDIVGTVGLENWLIREHSVERVPRELVA